MTRSVARGALALLLTALLVVSAVAGTASVAAQTTPPATPPEQASTPADDVYVTDDGDAVLVYESDTSEADAEGQLGMDVEEDLVYGLLTDSVEGDPDVTWRFSGLAQPDSLTANGTLGVPQPDVVESFDLAIAGESTPENASADLDLATTIGSQAGYGQFVQSVTTDGEVAMGPDSFSLAGDLQAQTALPMGQASSSSLTFQEVSDGYELAVTEERVLQSRQVADWQNRSAAEETVREQYVPTGDQLDGSAEVSFDEYSLTEATGDTRRLAVDYTVTYTGVDEALREEVATQLAQAPGASESAARTLADELFAASIDEVSYGVTSESGSVDGNLTVEVSDYADLVLAYLDYAQTLEPGAGGGAAPANLDQARAQFEAQQAADLEQRYTWSGDLEGSQDGALSLDLTGDYRTTNWAAYVDEMQSRDIPWYESRYALNGSGDGERIGLNGTLAFEGAELYESSLDQLGGVGAPGVATPEWGQALADAQPRTARVEGSYDADGLRVEAGAAFGNITAIRDAVASEYDVPPADEVVGRYDAENGSTHVRVNGAVSADATESDVRALRNVGDDTTVHLPGSWDREFDSMDAEQARDFLGIEASNGGIGPGFGAAVAVLALLAVALFAARRR